MFDTEYDNHPKVVLHKLIFWSNSHWFHIYSLFVYHGEAEK